LADLSLILNNSWMERGNDLGSPEEQLRQAMEDAGMEPPPEIALDGAIHRFNPDGAHGNKSGWYVAFPGDVPAGAFGDWKTSINQNWCARVSREMTPIERTQIKELQKKAQKQREAEEAKKHDVVAATVSEIWEGATDASPDHPYLKRKGVKPHGIKTTGDGRLIVPVFQPNNEIRTLQYIDSSGQKRFHSGGEVKGGSFQLGQEPTKRAYIAEGYATAATAFEVTGTTTFVAFNAGNLARVARAVREKHSTVEIIVIGDNDASGVGQTSARDAASQVGGQAIIPPNEGDINDYAQAGGDVSALLEPEPLSWLIPADQFVKKPDPVKWLVKKWLRANACMMMFGPSGSGKTFVALDMALRIASDGEIGDWCGFKVRHGTVIYLAGEGHHGLKARMAGWKHHHEIEHLDAFISRDGCDLNTPDGLQKTVSNIRQTNAEVVLIVVDTLHRFLHGDENSAQDAKTMLDACSILMREFDCSVLLVHHTGVNPDAQGRARGSSSWKGAQDIEIRVTSESMAAMQIKQTKNKDAELAPDTWMSSDEIEVPGWFDEDGEAVTTLVLRESSQPKGSTKKNLTDGQRYGMESYRAVAEERGQLLAGEFRGVGLEDWREEYYKISTAPSTEAKRKAFDRAREGLVQKGVLRVEHDRYFPKDKIETLCIVETLRKKMLGEL
jgi:phage/plasmid primase-like uncharacterized protein/KaiC/GvpD/RAD55 family RecA-like ATPase